ncbi:hypothetical protein [uncultured Desulfobulbus sp.]|uniref:hypothetical protein n=1 Tax=uncultured Desulfobulbus sp. TaxID=239745 RepID=UPI0029C7FFF1|nr:hypothetical protein [uncultured Desulfobulbus sp.]
MKKSQRDQISSIDDFEDLTLFANESFNTEDVDLFEFTSEESSPLTRLKSIILSLDWEINDDILQELDDELNNLQQTIWQNDKVAEVYLQGLSKIGNYIRTKGAYAHPNSIKLLLTFFYNFEKIISSEQITGEEITQLLKGDVRKFKILQYQINQNETETLAVSENRIEPSKIIEKVTIAPPQSDATKQLKAAILSLDWEVTDESLRLFNEKLAGFHQNMAGNKPALVLAQGLQALGDYIADERAAAHPEAFILLHSFNEALEQVLRPDGQRLEQEKIQDLLIDRINRLNNLKLLIAAPPGGLVDDQRIDEMVEELSTPAVTELRMEGFPQSEAESIVSPSMHTEDISDDLETSGPVDKQSTDILEAEIDTLFAIGSMPAMESADVQYPDEILSPDAIQPVEDELADDFIEAHLSTNRGLTPALSDTDETSGFDENAELLDQSTQSDLADQLDFLFSEAEASNDSALTFSALDSSDLEIAIDGEEESVVALTDMNPEIEQDTVEAALSDAEEPAEHPDLHSEIIQETETDPNALEIQSKLDNFFIDIDEEPAETINAPQTTVEEIEQSLFFNEEDNVQSALADSEEEQGFSEEAEVATLSFTPMDEIEEKLDFFFGTDADEEPEPDTYQHETLPSDLREGSLDLTLSEPELEQIIPPALDEFVSAEAGEYQEQSTFVGQIQPDESLGEALDLFFTDVEEEKHAPLPTAVDELTSALEATIDDIQDEPLTESRQIQLAALGALLPIVVRTPSHEKFAEAATLVANLKKTGLTTEQQSLVQLLDSVITMLVRLPTKDDASTEKLVNYLYEQLLAEHCLPGTLPEAIGRYTAWLQQASAIMPVIPVAADQDSEPTYAYTAKELYFELSELRTHIREEFAKLRLEMHHHKT